MDPVLHVADRFRHREHPSDKRPAGNLGKSARKASGAHEGTPPSATPPRCGNYGIAIVKTVDAGARTG
ncbi:hypothetical protein [Nocardia bovistercoris]|uniref:Uncharacterized protein n=1 Tax=Nocardia bovistercoris TaxID=2785916 RepID=A0A931IKF3_9NOCA|nr:hypothetical protein [Nocardia bovistercoris]MBH0781890.1 hypothetical protein [Nocardia bovistercoris]